MREYEVSSDKLNALELAGKLHGLRLGNKVVFSRADLNRELGEPLHSTPPPVLSRRNARRFNAEGDTGGQQQHLDLDLASAAA